MFTFKCIIIISSSSSSVRLLQRKPVSQFIDAISVKLCRHAYYCYMIKIRSRIRPIRRITTIQTIKLSTYPTFTSIKSWNKILQTWEHRPKMKTSNNAAVQIWIILYMSFLSSTTTYIKGKSTEYDDIHKQIK